MGQTIISHMNQQRFTYENNICADRGSRTQIKKTRKRLAEIYELKLMVAILQNGSGLVQTQDNDQLKLDVAFCNDLSTSKPSIFSIFCHPYLLGFPNSIY